MCAFAEHEFSFMGKIVLLYWTGIGHISWFTSNTLSPRAHLLARVYDCELRASAEQIHISCCEYMLDAYMACEIGASRNARMLSLFKNKLVQEHHDALKFNLCSFHPSPFSCSFPSFYHPGWAGWPGTFTYT